MLVFVDGTELSQSSGAGYIALAGPSEYVPPYAPERNSIKMHPARAGNARLAEQLPKDYWQLSEGARPTPRRPQLITAF